MDKRTILFVMSLTLALFLVNAYFEQGNVEEIRKWNEQLVAKKEDKLVKLTKETELKTAKTSALPLVAIYENEEATTPISVGLQTQSAVIALSWSDNLPNKIYINPLKSTEKPKVLTLASYKAKIGEPVIYRNNDKDVLQIEHLPEFGKFDLQLIVPTTFDHPPVAIYWGEYTDGHLDVVAEKIALLKKEVYKDKSLPETNFTFKEDALVAIKTLNGYFPVAIYRHEMKLLEPLDSLVSLKNLIKEPEQKSTVNSKEKASEKFYVLETPYQQLVFSSYGGAIAEINLPFNSKADELSVVKEIEFDRDMVKNHPYNAHFPSHAYYTEGESATKFIEHKEGKLGGYYPLIRRNLIEKDKRKSVYVQPRYYALNIVSEYPETAELVYEVKSMTKDSIVFETVQGHRKITKTYSVASEDEAPYCITLSINIEGDSRGLWITSGIPEVEWISGAPAPALKYRATRNKKSEVEAIDFPKDSTTVTSTYLDWICNSNGFLGMILDPLGENDPGYRTQLISGTVVPSRLTEIDQEYEKFKAEDLPGYMVMLPLKSTGGLTHFRVFAGPFAESVLKKVDQVYSDSTTGYNPDYISCQSFHGWFSFISEPFAKLLFILMKLFHAVTGSWAFSIVLLTVALRIMLYPLNAWSTKSMVRMQQIAPEVTIIQEKHKKDPKKAQIEVMNLYRERGVNPVSGCLPLLIQMPFLIGMFDLLKSTFELRGASFIPGWIDDLTAPDVVFSWSMPLPLIGNQFHLLPILLGGVMFVQQRFMSTAPKDVSLMTEQQRQQKFMANIMAVVFTVMFYNFPSGLNIYWLSSMILGIVQQYFTTKQLKNKPFKNPEVVVVKDKKNNPKKV